MKPFKLFIILLLVFSLCGCSLLPELSNFQSEITLPLTLPEAPSKPEITVPSEIAPPTAPPVPSSPQPTETDTSSQPADEDFVRITDYIPDAVIDLRYASENNFTGQVIYDFSEPYLRYGTVKKLIQVQQTLSQSGYRIKIWDAFRPTAAQFRLWEVCPDSTYVANPHNGFSNHSRGNTIDITIVNQDGNEVEMPTGFDDFSKKADRDFSDCTVEAAKNAAYLEEIMMKCGFAGYYGEWWHYTDTIPYPVEQNFNPTDKE